MANTRFDLLVEQDMRALEAAAITITAARDPIMHAALVGKYEGLKHAKELFRKANRTPDTEDDQ